MPLTDGVSASSAFSGHFSGFPSAWTPATTPKSSVPDADKSKPSFPPIVAEIHLIALILFINLFSSFHFLIPFISN